MRTTLILLFAVALGLQGFSQDSKFSMGLEAAIRTTHQLFDDQAVIESNDKTGGSVAGTLFFDVNARVQIKSGINFSFYRLEEIDYSPLLGCDNNGSGGADPRQSFYSLDFNLLYLGIPIESRFKLFGETNHVYAKAGLEFMFRISSEGNVFLHECGTSVNELANPVFSSNTFILNSRLGTGYEFKLAQKAKLYLEPFAELWLNKIFEERPALISGDLSNNSRLLGFGLAAGLRF